MLEFKPHVLRDYALLADGERGIVVGPQGDFCWMCAPRWDSEAIFSSLVGGAGVYAVTPAGGRFVWGGHYEEGSLIWRSRWVTDDEQILECREALALPAAAERAVILRRVQAVRGSARVRAVLDARAGFGSHPMSSITCEDEVWVARTGPLRVRWSGAPQARRDGDALVIELDLSPGEQHDFTLEVTDRTLPDEPVDPDRAWMSTEHAWRRAVPDLTASIAPRDSRQAYAVLHGLTGPSGGMVGAATTSMPERVDKGRNYDYRYTWIRDLSYAAQAAAVNGADDFLDGAVGFITERLLADGPDLKPAYTVSGGRVPQQYELELPGYPGSDVKIGNQVTEQFQLDAFGESLLVLAWAGRLDRLDTQHWHAVEVAVDAVRARRDDAGAGIWETSNEHWTHSRLICAAGLRAIATVAQPNQASEWTGLADRIVADADADCLHGSGRWQRSPTDDRVDASLLLPALRGAVPAHDPRSRTTLAAVRDDLTSDYYLYRFRHGHMPLDEAEGAFLLCGFQMAMALHQQGETAEALRWFERNRSACGAPGLFTEEFDVVQRQLRGNLPQAFVHAMLLESARRLGEPWPTDPAATST